MPYPLPYALRFVQSGTGGMNGSLVIRTMQHLVSGRWPGSPLLDLHTSFGFLKLAFGTLDFERSREYPELLRIRTYAQDCVDPPSFGAHAQ